jgi:hypothetical protein
LIRVRECATAAEFFRRSIFEVCDADVWRWKALKHAQLEWDFERAKR